MFKLEKCWTDRRWLTIGKLSVGFGPVFFVERIQWGERLVWYKKRRF